jgi:hypothetical protein
MPDSGTIMASRGRVDYYLWKGIPVARSWPRKSTQPRQAGEIVSSNEFTAAAVLTGAVATVVQEGFKTMHRGTGVTWVDHFRAQARGKPWIQGVG